MKAKVGTLAVLCAALAVPAPATAESEPSPANFKNAAKYCKALRAAAGEASFKAMFGGKRNAYGKCVSKAARRDAKQEDAAKANAAEQCKAEQAQDLQAFRQRYGTNKNGKNAHGKCVSQHAKQGKDEADARERDDVSSAKACKAEQAMPDEEFKASHGGKTFAEHYGTNDNHRNAFGKCVSGKSRAKHQS